MNIARRKRTVQRTAFTKALNYFNEVCNSEDDIEKEILAFQILEERISELEATSKEVMDLLYTCAETTDETIQEKMDGHVVYKAKFLEAKRYHNGRIKSETHNMNISRMNIEEQSETRKTFRLPKIELIHEDEHIDKEHKFQYLIQAMVPGSRAAGLVKSYPPIAENYEKAVSSLKQLFGRDDLLIEVYVRDLLHLILQNAVHMDKGFRLASLYDKLESHLRALDTLGVTTDKCAAILYPLVESSLPEVVLRAWQRSSQGRAEAAPGEGTIQPKDRLSRLIEFLEVEVRNEVKISMAMKGFSLKQNDGDTKKHKAFVENKDIPSATGLLDVKAPAKLCIFCNSKEHYADKCLKAKSISFEERQAIVKEKGKCFKCLRAGHSAKFCRFNVKCGKCSRRHITLMCPAEIKECEAKDEQKMKDEEVKSEHNLASVNNTSEIFLQTLKVEVYNGNKREIVRVLIDTGSQRSYIISEIAARLEYEPIAEQKLNHLLFGGGNLNSVSHKEYKVHVRALGSDFACNFSVLDQAMICGYVPVTKDENLCAELKTLNIQLSDWKDDNGTVSLLIGADVAGKLITGQRHVLKNGLVALETRLGWTVLGAITKNKESQDNVVSGLSLIVQESSIEDLWSLDTLGIRDPIASKTKKEEDNEMKAAFLETVTVNNAGRYEVALPWKETHPPLQENRNLAEKRLKFTIEKLKKEGLYQDYNTIFDEWLADGIVECVPKEEVDNWGYYLPHRHVVKEGSTTRIRSVFDASAKQPPHPSLNECLRKGPNLIEQLPDVLLRFRTGKIGVIADMKRAFLQISVRNNERDLMRFLWEDEKGNLVILRHCRVVFGICSSPFMLDAIISLHLVNLICGITDNTNYNIMKENICKLKDSFYVDNCVASVNSNKELYNFMEQATIEMKLAAFDLRGWEYNDDGTIQAQTPVLGIIWDKQLDSLSLNTGNLINICLDRVTKRKILSIVHQVFDPLGFAAPITLGPRLLLKEIWALNLKWDDEVATEIKSRFVKWFNELQDLDKVKVPRCIVGEIEENDEVTIHTFCDASQMAYAAVVFIRIQRATNVNVTFIQAKSRVAPMQVKDNSRYSIPRLELLAATIGARLCNQVLKILYVKPREIFYWSDSTTVLAWIRRQSNWGTFVYNRVKEIREITKVESWRHVPGSLNPGDLPSRGCSVKRLLTSKWWEGPSWLRDDINDWPDQKEIYNEEEIKAELKAKDRKLIMGKQSLACSVVETTCVLEIFKRFSSYAKIIRVAA